MAKVVVFDSGLGSLSIIKAIKKCCKCKIIYFADQKNFPYGKKTKSELKSIIEKSIQTLHEKFSPDLIIVGSNTPTIILDINDSKIIGVNPPLILAEKISKTKNIGILGTQALVGSKELQYYINKCKLSEKTHIEKINVSKLIGLVESARFLTNKNYCKKIIKEILKDIIKKNIDVCTLSSTHLPFVKPLLKSQFPKVKFIDPADCIANEISRKLNQEKRSSLKIFTSGNVKKFEKNLHMLGIKNKVTFLKF